MLILAEFDLATKVEILWVGIPAAAAVLFGFFLWFFGRTAKEARQSMIDKLGDAGLKEAEKGLSVAIEAGKSAQTELTRLLTQMKADSREAHSLVEQMRSGKPSPGCEIQFGHISAKMIPGAGYASGVLVFDKPFSGTPIVFVGECSGGNWLIVKVDQKDDKSFQWAAHRIFASSTNHMKDEYSFQLQWIAVCPHRSG